MAENEEIAALQQRVELIYYYFDRGFALREPSQERPARWLAPLLQRIPGLPSAAAPILELIRAPRVELRAYRQARDEKSKFLQFDTQSALVVDPELTKAVLEAGVDDIEVGEMQRESMLMFQPFAVAATANKGDFLKLRAPNEHVLASERRIHPGAAEIVRIVGEEVGRMDAAGTIRWGDIDGIARRVALRVVLGAAHDSVRERLDELMRIANLGGPLLVMSQLRNLIPGHKEIASDGSKVRPDFSAFPPRFARRAEALLEKRSNPAWVHPLLNEHRFAIAQLLDYAPSSSLAGGMQAAAKTHGLSGDEAVDQVTHWLFAIRGTAAVLCAYTLALLASSPRAGHPVVTSLVAEVGDVHRLRAALLQDPALGSLDLLERWLLESARLFPPTPLLVRGIRCDAQGCLGELRKSGIKDILIHNAANGREWEFVGDRPNAVRPNRWQFGLGLKMWAIADRVAPVFGGGPKRCPGANLGMLVATAMTAGLLLEYELRSVENTAPGQAALSTEEVPFNWDQFGIQIEVRRRR